MGQVLFFSRHFITCKYRAENSDRSYAVNPLNFCKFLRGKEEFAREVRALDFKALRRVSAILTGGARGWGGSSLSHGSTGLRNGKKDGFVFSHDLQINGTPIVGYDPQDPFLSVFGQGGEPVVQVQVHF